MCLGFFKFFFLIAESETTKDLIREENQNSDSSYLFRINMNTKIVFNMGECDFALSYFIFLPFYL